MIKTNILPSFFLFSNGPTLPALYSTLVPDFYHTEGGNLYKYESKEPLIGGSTKWTIAYTILKNKCNFGANLYLNNDGTVDSSWDVPILKVNDINASQHIYSIIGYVNGKKVINYLISKDGGRSFEQKYNTIKLDNERKQVSLIFRFDAMYNTSQEWVQTTEHLRTYEDSKPNIYIRNEWQHDFEILTTGFFVYCGFYKTTVTDNSGIVTVQTWPKLGWLRKNSSDDWNLYIPDSTKGDNIQAATKSSRTANIDLGNYVVRQLHNPDSGTTWDSQHYDQLVQMIINVQNSDNGTEIDPTYFNSVFTKV